MSEEPFYKAHWREIDHDRLSAYKEGFAWDITAEALYAPARIGPDLRIADFGCGPGKIAVELARRVGAGGEVHAVDINAEFLKITRNIARDAGVGDRLHTHQSDGSMLPFEDRLLDRVTARNTLMYVDDPVVTLREFHRVLRPGGLAHAIDGDWFMMVAEPVAHDLWHDFVTAAAHACRHADMGRKLAHAFRRAGFGRITIEITARADQDGRLLGMIRNMGKYAAQSGTMSAARSESVVAQMESALAEGRYLAVSPQFVVTGEAG